MCMAGLALGLPCDRERICSLFLPPPTSITVPPHTQNTSSINCGERCCLQQQKGFTHLAPPRIASTLSHMLSLTCRHTHAYIAILRHTHTYTHVHAHTCTHARMPPHTRRIERQGLGFISEGEWHSMHSPSVYHNIVEGLWGVVMIPEVVIVLETNVSISTRTLWRLKRADECEQKDFYIPLFYNHRLMPRVQLKHRA